jgi:hypothetical protein
MLANDENQICASTPNVIGPANYQSSLEVCDAVLQILQEDKRWELGKLDYQIPLQVKLRPYFISAQQAAERLSQLVGPDED